MYKGQSLDETGHPCFWVGLPTMTYSSTTHGTCVLFRTIVNKRPAPLLELADTFTDSNH